MGNNAKKQQELEGFERESIKAIDERVADYVEPMYKQRELARATKQRRELLVATMVEHNVTEYEYVDGEYSYTLNLSPAVKLNVKRQSLADDEDDRGLTVIDGGDGGEADTIDGEEHAPF